MAASRYRITKVEKNPSWGSVTLNEKRPFQAVSLVPLTEFESVTFCSANFQWGIFGVFWLFLSHFCYIFAEVHAISSLKPNFSLNSMG
jgi:hypothetical protein